jgi:hypothetical protein
VKQSEVEKSSLKWNEVERWREMIGKKASNICGKMCEMR